jgi:hypothetical protein
MPKLVPHEPSNGSQVAPPDAEWRPVDDPPPPSSSQKLDELMPVIRDYGSSLKTSVFLSLEGPLTGC